MAHRSFCVNQRDHDIERVGVVSVRLRDEPGHPTMTPSARRTIPGSRRVRAGFAQYNSHHERCLRSAAGLFAVFVSQGM